MTVREFDSAILDRYLKLGNQDDKTQALYVWIDATDENVRAKTRTLQFNPTSPEQLPIWNFDGSSTGQAEGSNSDIYLYPKTLYKDPFRIGNKIVLCETFKYDNTPTETNFRHICCKTVEKTKHLEPLFGLEQEFMSMEKTGQPYCWPANGYPEPQGDYHCGVGSTKVHGRDVVEAHYRACLYSGICIAGTNAESVPSQWEYQIGPGDGLTVSDDIWMSRYFLNRVAEDFGVCVSLDPKPVRGCWNGAGLHCNISTNQMRAAGGMKEIESAIQKLSENHEKHLKKYDPKEGKDNERRLIGSCEAPNLLTFTSGIADRTASVRIPRHVSEAGNGYFEDRRPASNADPYVLTDILLKTICIEE